MSLQSAETSSCRRWVAWASRLRCLWTVQRWVGTSPQRAASACPRPVPPSTIRNSGLRSPRLTRSSRTTRQASLVSPPMFLTANSTFWPSSRTPSTTRSTIEVARLAAGVHVHVLDGYLLLPLAAMALQRLDLRGECTKQLHREVPIAVLLRDRLRTL